MENEGGLVHENERVDDLELSGLRAIQNPASFCFGTDSVLLAHFSRAKKGCNALDLGTGSGVLALLIWGRYRVGHITGIEIQPAMADMARRSVLLNGLKNEIEIICGDFTDDAVIPKRGSYDLVVANPPYIARGAGDTSTDEGNLIARHEVAATLEGVVRAASIALKSRGRLCMVHQASRAAEALRIMDRYSLVPKRAMLVQPSCEKPPRFILVEAQKNGRAGMAWEPTLCIYGGDGAFTKRMNEIYRKENA